MDAGKLAHPVSILAFSAGNGDWGWTERKRTWANVEERAGKSLFSAVGLGTNSLKLTLRRQELTLHEAISWRGKHLFLTNIRDNRRLYLDVDAAAVELAACEARAPAGPRFPAVLTEKYIRHEQETPMATNAICHVLVTPKPIVLTPGGLVDVGGEPFVVLTAHVLDPFKNEYELYCKRDL